MKQAADLMVGATFLGALLFVITYLGRNWQKTAVGRNVMVFMIVIMVVSGLAVSTIIWGREWPYRDAIRALAWGSVAAVIWWRNALLIRAAGGAGRPEQPMGATMSATPDTAGSSQRRVSDVAVSLIRTLVPYSMASLFSWAAVHWNVVIPPEWSANAVVWVTLGVASGYYAAARWLERRKGTGGAAAAARLLGRWLLGGVLVQPVYSHPPTDRAFLVEPDGESRRPE